MAVKIFIKRQVMKKDKPELGILLNRLRSLTLSQKGYISGETMRRVDTPDEYMVISTWNSFDNWQKWFQSEQRKAIQYEIDLLLGEKTEYAIYEEGMGS